MFDSVTLADHGLSSQTSLHSLQLRQPSPTSTSSAADRHLEPPQTYEGLLAANTRLKTRVSELEVINELYRGRVTELEQSDASARRSEMIARDSEMRLRRSLDDARRQEDDFKRRINELERQVLDHNGHGSFMSNGNPPEPLAKKIRLADVVDQSSAGISKFDSP